MNPGAGLGDDQPNTVEVVSIALWVVGRQHSPHRRREVGETGDWRDKEGKKWEYLLKNYNSEGVLFRRYTATDHVTMYTVDSCLDRLRQKKVQDRNKLSAVGNQLSDKKTSMFPWVLTGWRQEVARGNGAPD